VIERQKAGGRGQKGDKVDKERGRHGDAVRGIEGENP